MKNFFLLFAFALFVSALSGANWPASPGGTLITGGVFDATPASSTFTNVATNNYVSVTIDPMENWTITLSAGEISVFAGPGIPTAGTAPISSSTGGSVSLSPSSPGTGTFYVLFTWLGPPNRTVTVSGSGIQLPVTWKSINALPNDNEVLISWATAQEKNNDFFTVEKSSNGQNWEEIGRVFGAGNSSTERWYEFSDVNPSDGINYYRIRQTDFDGKSSFSTITSVKVDAASSNVKILANPDSITITSSSEDAVNIAIFDVSGRQVLNKNIYFYDEILVPRTGMYIVKINGITTKKVVVP